VVTRLTYRIVLSKRRHLPVIKTEHGTYPFWEIFNLLFGIRCQIYEYKARLLPHHKNMISELAIWEKWYLPSSFSLKEKTVLDIGSGSGETALFYFHHGASKLVCVEKSSSACRFARANLRNLNAEIINEPFKLDHLKIPHDYLKMDIEGGEVLLLKYDAHLKPCVIEAHSKELEKELCDKFNLKKAFNLNANTSLIVSK